MNTEIIMWLEINGKKISILPDRPIFSVACEVVGQDKMTREEKYLLIEWLEKYIKQKK